MGSMTPDMKYTPPAPVLTPDRFAAQAMPQPTFNAAQEQALRQASSGGGGHTPKFFTVLFNAAFFVASLGFVAHLNLDPAVGLTALTAGVALAVKTKVSFGGGAAA